jgi:hypothetical protein
MGQYLLKIERSSQRMEEKCQVPPRHGSCLKRVMNQTGRCIQWTSGCPFRMNRSQTCRSDLTGALWNPTGANSPILVPTSLAEVFFGNFKRKKSSSTNYAISAWRYWIQCNTSGHMLEKYFSFATYLC